MNDDKPKTFKQWCDTECPQRLESEGGMPNCDCPYQEDEDE